MEATAAFADNTLSRIIYLVEEAQDKKGRAQQWMERFGRIYSPIVLLTAVANGLRAGGFVSSPDPLIQEELQMKEIKAFMHRNRVADVVHALFKAGHCPPACSLSIVDVQGTLEAIDSRERDFSLEAGAEMITEVKLELLVQDDAAEEVVALLHEYARTGQELSGWICVYDVARAEPIRG